MIGLVAVASPVGAQDTETGEVEWIVTVPRTDRSTTVPIGFAIDEEAGEIVAVLTVETTVTFGGGDVPEATYDTGTYLVRIDLEGRLLDVAPLDAPANALTITHDRDILVVSEERTLARLSSDGTVRWERRLSGLRPSSVAELENGTIVVGTELRDTTTFGAGEPTEVTLTHTGGVLGSSVIAWFAPDGAFLGAELLTDVSDIAVAAGPDNSVRMLGPASAPVTLGAGQPNETSFDIDTSGQLIPRETLLASYDVDRQLEWAVSTGIRYSGDVLDVATSADGAAVLWLSIDETGVIGEGLPTETEVRPLGLDEFGDDHVLARYSADGTFEWVHVIGSAEAAEEEYRALGVRSSGEIIVVGDSGPGEFVIDGPDTPILSMGDLTRALVMVFTEDGTLSWTTAYGSESFDVGWGAAVLDGGDVIVFGLTGDATVFGLPGEEVAVADGPSWLVARIDGLEPPPPTTTTTTTTTTTVPDEDPADDPPAEDDPEPEASSPEPTPDDSGDGGGAVVAVVIVVLAVLGGAGVVLLRRRAG